MSSGSSLSRHFFPFQLKVSDQKSSCKKKCQNKAKQVFLKMKNKTPQIFVFNKKGTKTVILTTLLGFS